MFASKPVRMAAGFSSNQLREFPLAEHDDGPDALEMAIRLAESEMLLNTQPAELACGVRSDLSQAGVLEVVRSSAADG